MQGRQKHFKDVAKTLFESTDGKIVLKYLKEDVLDKSPMDSRQDQVFYNIGQQDLVRSLLNLLEDEAELDEVPVVNYDPYNG